MNSPNSPEKLHVLATHEFRYKSDGMGVAAPGWLGGEWSEQASRSKAASPRIDSPRNKTPRSQSPRVYVVRPASPLEGARCATMDGERPKSRGTPDATADRPGSPAAAAEKRHRGATDTETQKRPISKGPLSMELDIRRSSSHDNDSNHILFRGRHGLKTSSGCPRVSPRYYHHDMVVRSPLGKGQTTSLYTVKRMDSMKGSEQH
jgi:hypothetical protein